MPGTGPGRAGSVGSAPGSGTACGVPGASVLGFGLVRCRLVPDGQEKTQEEFCRGRVLSPGHSPVLPSRCQLRALLELLLFWLFVPSPPSLEGKVASSTASSWEAGACLLSFQIGKSPEKPAPK